MTFSPIFRAVAAAALSAFVAAAASAAPTTWTFAQGYGASGTLTGTFTGEDLNNDQLITYIDGAQNELFGITLTFNGPDFTGTFGPGQIQIGGIDNNISDFQYVVGSTSMDAILVSGPNAEGSAVTLFTPVTGLHTLGPAWLYWTAGSKIFSTGPLDPLRGNVTIYDADSIQLEDYQSIQAVQVQVSAVPEPAAYLLMVAGLALVGGAARRRLNSASA